MFLDAGEKVPGVSGENPCKNETTFEMTNCVVAAITISIRHCSVEPSLPHHQNIKKFQLLQQKCLIKLYFPYISIPLFLPCQKLLYFSFPSVFSPPCLLTSFLVPTVGHSDTTGRHKSKLFGNMFNVGLMTVKYRIQHLDIL